jgi:hypothetical protein
MSEMARQIAATLPAGWLAAFDPGDLTRPCDLQQPFRPYITPESLNFTVILFLSRYCVEEEV